MGKTGDMFSFKKTQMMVDSMNKGVSIPSQAPGSQKALMFKTFNTEKSMVHMS